MSQLPHDPLIAIPVLIVVVLLGTGFALLPGDRAEDIPGPMRGSSLDDGPVSVTLEGEGMDPSTYINIPSDASTLVSMVLNVSTGPGHANRSNAIRALSLDVGADGDREWSFETGGAYSWGYQSVFLDNSSRSSVVDPWPVNITTPLNALRFVEGTHITSASLHLGTRNVPLSSLEVTGPSTPGATCVLGEDMDGDGDTDLVVAGPTGVRLYSNDDIAGPGTGDATSFTPGLLSTPNTPVSMVPVDMDGDGDMDLVVGCAPPLRALPELIWLENPSTTGAWSAHNISTTALSADDILVLDVDLDGDMDVVSLSLADGMISASMNPGIPTGSWGGITVEAGAEYASGISGGVSDDTPVIFAGFSAGTSGSLRMYTLSDSKTTFNSTFVSDGTPVTALDSCDMDHDGSLEVFSYSASSGRMVWSGVEENGSWSAHTLATGISDVDRIDVGDADEDGYLRLDATGSSNGTRVSFLEPDLDTSTWYRHEIPARATPTVSGPECDPDSDGNLTPLFADIGSGNAGWLRESYAIPRDVDLSLDGSVLYSRSGPFFPGTSQELNITDALESCLEASGSYDHKDGYSNRYHDLWLDLSAFEARGLVVKDLEIAFDATVGTRVDLTEDVNAAILSGSDRVFIVVSGKSRGSVELSIGEQIYNFGPTLASGQTIPLEVDEEGDNGEGLDLWGIVRDDRDPSYLLSYSLTDTSGSPGGSRVRITDNRYLVVNMSECPDYNGEFILGLTVNDREGAFAFFNVTVSVNNVNDAPRRLVGQLEIAMDEDTSWSRDLSTFGLFLDPEGDPLYFNVSFGDTEAAGLPPGITDELSLDLSGTVLTLTPDPNLSAYRVPVLVMCNDTMPVTSDPVCLLFTISNINDPPVLLPIPTVTLAEDQTSGPVLDLSEYILDPDTLTDELIFGIDSDKLVSMSVRRSDHHPYLYLDRLEPDLNGEATLHLSVSDGDGGDTAAVHVVVTPVNDPPTIAITTLSTGQNVSGQFLIAGSASDIDSSFEVAIKIGNNDWLILGKEASWSYPVDSRSFSDGTLLIKVRVRDAGGLTAYDYRAIVIRNTILPGDGPDSDGDGVCDLLDMFPADPYEWADSDLDGVGDNTDAFPFDPGEWADTDLDGVGDNADPRPMDPSISDSSQIGSPSPPSQTAYPMKLTGPAIFLGLGFVAAGGLLFFLATEVGFVMIMTLAVTLYSKLSHRKVLDHEVRGLIRGYIIANPGDHYSSIKRKLRLRNGTLAYHLKILEDNDLIISRKDGIYKRYYPTRMKIDMSKVPVSTQESILNIIVESPGISRQDICGHLELSRQVVNYHTKGLVNAGLITYSKKGRNTFYSPTENT